MSTSSSAPMIDYTIKDLDKVIKIDTGHSTIKNIKTSRLTAPGENYLSLVLRVEIDIENKKDGTIEKKDIVAKRVPLGDREFIHMNIHVMYNEIRWYTEIASLLIDFSREYGIECSQLYPKYCGSRLSLDPSNDKADKDSLLLVENLNPEGYRNDDRFIGSDFITCKTILKDLALFHAIPLAMKFNQPAKFKIVKDYLASCLPEKPFHDSKEDGDANKHHKKHAELLLKQIENMPECAPHIGKLKPIIIKPTFGSEDWTKDGPEPWSTIIHSDFWVNNILVKPGIEGQEPLIKFVDFQVCRYNSFAADLIFFLLTSAQNDIQKNQLDDLLKIYYEEFVDLLQRFKLDIKLTYDQYLSEIGRVLKLTELGHALHFNVIILAERNSKVDVAIHDVNPMDLMNEMIENLNEKQKERIILVIDQVVKRNWI